MGVEDGGYKPTEVKQVMETDSKSKDFGRLKNDDEFTRGIAERERETRENPVTSHISPEITDIFANSDIVTKLVNNAPGKKWEAPHEKVKQKAREDIRNINETKEANAKRKASEEREERKRKREARFDESS